MSMSWDIKILKDPLAGFGLPDFFSYDYDIEKPIPSNYGIGIVFTVDGKGKYETLMPRTIGGKRIVSFRANTYMGLGDPNACHYYGRFNVSSAMVKVLEVDPSEAKYHKVGDIFGTNVIPKKCDNFDFQVTRVVDKNIFSYSFLTGEREQRCEKGERFYGFDDLKTLREVMDREFKRIFKKGWMLQGSHGHSIDEEFDREI